LSAIETEELLENSPDNQVEQNGILTISSGVVRLNVHRLHLAILDDKSISLSACMAEDWYSVETEV